MAALNEIQLHAGDRGHAQNAAAAAIGEVRRIEAKYSRYRPESVVSRINAQAGGAPVAIDAETAKLLDYAEACFRQSRGRFDPTSGILRRAWRFEPGAAVPTAAQLAPLLAAVGWSRHCGIAKKRAEFSRLRWVKRCCSALKKASLSRKRR